MSESQAIREAVGQFAEGAIRPSVRGFDAQPSAGFPRAIVRQGQAMGLGSITVPERWGGVGLDAATAGMVLEDIAAVCPGFAIIFAASLWGIAPILLAGDERQGTRLLETPPPGGDLRPVQDPRQGADGALDRLFALVVPPVGRPPSLAARRDGGGYIVSGTAAMVFNAGWAGLYTVFAGAEDGLICVAVPSTSAGLCISRPVDKLGLHVAPAASLSFESVRVRAENILARSSQAEEMLGRIHAQQHALIGAVAVGTARAALREASSYAEQRFQGGRIIAQHQAVAAMLADMRIREESARALVREVLASPSDPFAALLARICATQGACATTIDAVQVLGGYGYMTEYPVEKLLRDAHQLSLVGGSNGWLRVCLADARST